MIKQKRSHGRYSDNSYGFFCKEFSKLSTRWLEKFKTHSIQARVQHGEAGSIIDGIEEEMRSLWKIAGEYLLEEKYIIWTRRSFIREYSFLVIFYYNLNLVLRIIKLGSFLLYVIILQRVIDFLFAFLEKQILFKLPKMLVCTQLVEGGGGIRTPR